MQALDERRLRLTLDGSGTVAAVGDSPAELFGFDPKILLGLSASSFMDIFNINAGAGAKVHLLNAMMVKLAERTTFNPGASWRVGVISPVPLQKGHVSLGAITKVRGPCDDPGQAFCHRNTLCLTLPHFASQALVHERTVPSTMTLRLRKATQAELVAMMGKQGRRSPTLTAADGMMTTTTMMHRKSPMLTHHRSTSPVSISLKDKATRATCLGGIVVRLRLRFRT